MTAGRSILQVTPRPCHCGVTASSLALQAALRAQGTDREILCLTDTTEIPPEFRRIESTDELADMRGMMAVQLSPYGFDAWVASLRYTEGQLGHHLFPRNLGKFFVTVQVSVLVDGNPAVGLSPDSGNQCVRILQFPVDLAMGASAAGKDRVAFGNRCPYFVFTHGMLDPCFTHTSSW